MLVVVLELIAVKEELYLKVTKHSLHFLVHIYINILFLYLYL